MLDGYLELFSFFFFFRLFKWAVQSRTWKTVQEKHWTYYWNSKTKWTDNCREKLRTTKTPFSWLTTLLRTVSSAMSMHKKSPPKSKNRSKRPLERSPKRTWYGDFKMRWDLWIIYIGLMIKNNFWKLFYWRWQQVAVTLRSQRFSRSFSKIKRENFVDGKWYPY